MNSWKLGCNLPSSLTYSLHTAVLLPHDFCLNFCSFGDPCAWQQLFLMKIQLGVICFRGKKKQMYGALQRLHHLMKVEVSFHPCWARQPCHTLIIFSSFMWFLGSRHHIDNGVTSKKKCECYRLFLEKKNEAYLKMLAWTHVSLNNVSAQFDRSKWERS